MSRASLLVLFAALVLSTSLPASGQAPTDAWRGEIFAEGLAGPVDVVFGPDGTLYYAELDSGRIMAIPPGANEPLPDALVQVPATRSENGGLLGLALDPEFDATGAFFVYYSTEKAGAGGGQVNRVSRLDASGETVLVDDIPWFERHNGGRLVFTGTDTLVAMTGDNELREPAQDPESLLGKSLRMTREGEPAPDNPDPTSLIYTIGHRNPFGLAYDAESDTLWNTENGPQHGDEINIIRAGENYGWPEVVGIAKHPAYADPVVAYEETIAPTGATVLDGDLYFAAVNDGKLRRVSQDESGAWVEEVVWDTKVPGLDVEAGPDGRLYFASFSTIHVITPPGYVAPTTPPSPAATPTATPSPTAGPGPAPDSPPTESNAPTVETEADIPAGGWLLAAVAIGLACVGRRRRN